MNRRQFLTGLGATGLGAAATIGCRGAVGRICLKLAPAGAILVCGGGGAPVLWPDRLSCGRRG